MKILKFGGTSVANAANIKQVISIAKKSSKQAPIAVVVSALGGATDVLLQAGFKAEKKDSSYLTEIDSLEKRHITTIKELIADSHQEEVISEIHHFFNQLASILEGIYLIKVLAN